MDDLRINVAVTFIENILNSKKQKKHFISAIDGCTKIIQELDSMNASISVFETINMKDELYKKYCANREVPKNIVGDGLQRDSDINSFDHPRSILDDLRKKISEERAVFTEYRDKLSARLAELKNVE
ncbi:hypothetical protein [Rhizobium sp. PDO1-076]|uniref:hypothetical protein n=1 Tax=Rhizobium sp. PDO1-076 TaxID=1125979 RepID=UPI001360B436|nr:hypothetical protein [Rhizobium sp. PDO1-076]